MAVLVDSYSESNQNIDRTLAGAFAHAGAQSFTASAGTLESATFYLKKTGSPTGNATARLYDHTGTMGTSSVPTGAALATSDNLNVSTLTTSYQLISIPFSGINQYTLSASPYCIAIFFNGGDTSNYILAGVDSTSPTHAGNESTFNGSSWNALSTRDVIFYVYKADAGAATHPGWVGKGGWT